MAETYSWDLDFVKGILQLAQQHHKQVRIAYLDKKGNEEVRVFEPYEMTTKIVGGYCHLRKGYRTFLYERIVRIVLFDLDHTRTMEEFKKNA